MKEQSNTDQTGKRKRGFHARIPDELRAEIDQVRKSTGRSVNAELINLIRTGLDASQRDLIASIEKLHAAVEALNKRLDKK